MYNQEEKKGIKFIVIGLVFLVAIVGACMWIIPTYSVWSARQSGKAKLAHADFERETQVVNAKANLEAQKYNAEAEVVRAEGIAKANNAIKDSITEMYVKYLWVSTLDRTSNQIIYVPLGSDGLPVSEAGRAVK